MNRHSLYLPTSTSVPMPIFIYLFIHLFVNKLTAVFLTTAMRCISNRTMYMVSQQSHTEFFTNEIQGGAEETRVFQMASTRQGWG